jgi:hypothetical protein
MVFVMISREHLIRVVAGYLNEFGLQLVANSTLGLFLINEFSELLTQLLFQ